MFLRYILLVKALPPFLKSIPCVVLPDSPVPYNIIFGPKFESVPYILTSPDEISKLYNGDP